MSVHKQRLVATVPHANGKYASVSGSRLLVELISSSADPYATTLRAFELREDRALPTEETRPVHTWVVSREILTEALDTGAAPAEAGPATQVLMFKRAEHFLITVDDADGGVTLEFNMFSVAEWERRSLTEVPVPSGLPEADLDRLAGAFLAWGASRAPRPRDGGAQ